jgi:outer membrane translocation and assembly module TamA
MFGLSKDIRGYPVGRYQNNRMIVGQAEYRRELFWRFGAVGFFGAGEVADKFSDFNASNILPGGGLGLRFLLDRQDHINLSVDYAWGRGSTALYISLGEAF